jgi:hypothetical protein
MIMRGFPILQLRKYVKTVRKRSDGREDRERKSGEELCLDITGVPGLKSWRGDKDTGAYRLIVTNSVKGLSPGRIEIYFSA